MRLVVSQDNKAFKLEQVRSKVEYLKMTEILDCFKEEGQTILFMLPESWLKHFGNALTNFVEDRVVTTTREYISPRIGYRDEATLYWFRIDNIDDFNEMCTLIRRDQFLCVVVEKNDSPKDYIFHIDLGEFGKLVILEKREGDFLKTVLPRIKKIIPNIVQEAATEDEEY